MGRFSIQFRIEQVVIHHIPIMMNGNLGVPCPYKIIWRRVLVSYGVIVEASTHDLKVSKARGEYLLAFICYTMTPIPMYSKVFIIMLLV